MIFSIYLKVVNKIESWRLKRDIKRNPYVTVGLGGDYKTIAEAYDADEKLILILP